MTARESMRPRANGSNLLCRLMNEIASPGQPWRNSTTVLKPRQRVRVVLSVDPYLIRAAGTVAWALFEIPKGGQPPHYRAGLEFSSADPEPLLQFCIEQAAEASAL